MTNMINGLSVAMICSLLFAAGCGSWTDGLKPGDIYSKDLDVVRNEGAADVRLLTVYGQEVIETRAPFRSANLGPRQPRMQIAVVAPEGASVNGTGVRSEYGDDHSVLREIMEWGAMRTKDDLNNTVRKTLTWEYDGRRQEARIGGESFPLVDGNRFVVLLDKDRKPSAHRVNDTLEVPPYVKGKEDELRKFFNQESAKPVTDLSADELVSIDQLRGMEEGQVLKGVFRPGGDMALPYSFSISSKGNGSLAFGTYCIRIYDAHSDRLLFAPPGSLGTDYLLDQHQQDVNADGWLDLVFTGTAICTGEKESDPQTSRSVRSVFLYDPQTASFTNSVPDDAVYVYTFER